LKKKELIGIIRINSSDFIHSKGMFESGLCEKVGTENED